MADSLQRLPTTRILNVILNAVWGAAGPTGHTKPVSYLSPGSHIDNVCHSGNFQLIECPFH